MSAIPLLLTAGTPEIGAQVYAARTAGDIEELWHFGRLFCCWIDPRGLREVSVLHWTQQHARLGCIAVDSSRLREWLSDDRVSHTSYVIFRAEAFHDAWQVARLLAGSNLHRPATVLAEGLHRRIFVLVAPAHHLIEKEDE